MCVCTSWELWCRGCICESGKAEMGKVEKKKEVSTTCDSCGHEKEKHNLFGCDGSKICVCKQFKEEENQ